jgi:DNA-binding CsgD family transcriptional regulator/PAS domain-containing protein
MARDRRAMLALIGLIYDSVLEPERWAEVLRTMTHALSATAAIFWAHRPSAGAVEFLFTADADPAAPAANELYFWSRTIWAAHCRSAAKPGSLHTGTELPSEEQLLASRCDGDFVKRNDLTDLATLVVVNEPNHLSILSFMRSKGAARFDDSDLRSIRTVAPHIMRAVKIQSHVRSNQAAPTWSAEVLHQLPVGVCILDAEGRIILLNHAAEAIAKACDGLTIRHRRLVVASGPDRAAFEARLSGILAAVNERSAALPPPGAAVAVTRPSGRPMYRLLLTPLPRSAATAPVGRDSVVIWIQDPEHRTVPRQELLRQLYGLSDGEAAVVASIVAGQELSRIAEQRGVERSTVATQLKRAFLKTGLNRQRDLVQIWSGLPIGEQRTGEQRR